MNRLPHGKMVRVPMAQRRRLQRWLHEWHIERALRDEDEIGLQAPTSPVPPAGRLGPSTAISEKHPRPGQIRLLFPETPALRCRPRYVVILHALKSSNFLIAPFGVFSEPAVPGEWKTSRAQAHLATLCLWNTRKVPASLISRSWSVDNLTPKELAAARTIHHASTTRRAIPARFRDAVGPPLRHPLDPRHEYLDEERTWMDQFLSVVPEQGANQPLWSLRKREHQLPLAAESGTRYQAVAPRKKKKPGSGGSARMVSE